MAMTTLEEASASFVRALQGRKHVEAHGVPDPDTPTISEVQALATLAVAEELAGVREELRKGHLG